MDEQGIRILADNVVLKAVEDYRDALRGRVINHIEPADMIKDCETFFRSEWFSLLTAIDGETIIIKLREEYFDECNIDSGNP